MDVRFILFFILITLSACSERSDTVFPERHTPQSETCKSQRLEDRFVVLWADGRVTHHASQDAETFVADFVNPRIDDIEHVEFDKVFRREEVFSGGQFPGDPDWGQRMTEAAAAWSAGALGENITVGITDQGIDYQHPQLRTRLAVNLSESQGLPGVDDDNNGFVDDVFGWDFSRQKPTPELGTDIESWHGTHVAGIVAAEHGAGPVKGIAPKAQLIASAFLDRYGRGSLFGALSALQYAADRGAQIINASWGGADCSFTLRKKMEELSQKGILLVFAAGNEGVDLSFRPHDPASFNFPNQLSVAALRSDGYIDAYSNTSYQYTHIAAPGTGIFSTVPGPGSGYLDGTSMAAPFVSGAAALVWSARPRATAAEVKKALLDSVSRGPYRVETQGRLNIRQAIEEIRRQVPL